MLINVNHLYPVHTINLDKLAEEFQYQKVPSALAKLMSVPIYIFEKTTRLVQKLFSITFSRIKKFET